jgi:bifunctional DNA-binding transcriptional regulator/antitoxin component of YhaV-PrlF toxin-antitoxin module
MQAIEFTTSITADQTIVIPEKFRTVLGKHKRVRVIVLFEEDIEPDPEILVLNKYLDENLENSHFDEK